VILHESEILNHVQEELLENSHISKPFIGICLEDLGIPCGQSGQFNPVQQSDVQRMMRAQHKSTRHSYTARLSSETKLQKNNPEKRGQRPSHEDRDIAVFSCPALADR
jgi:hypothetical protein